MALVISLMLGGHNRNTTGRLRLNCATGGIDDAPPRSKKAADIAQGAKRELSTVANRPMRSSTGLREDGPVLFRAAYRRLPFYPGMPIRRAMS